ncbi:hypothetical protein KCF3NO3_03530 [Chryseobacterium sp. KCF3-3]
MDIKKRKIVFKILMFLSAFLLGLSLIDFDFNITKVSISLSLLLTMVASYYEWNSISKKIKNTQVNN